MDILELSTENKIRSSVAKTLRSISESFSILTVGHITQFRDPINCGIGVAEALEIFADQKGVTSLPVEGDMGVIGIIKKKDLQKKKSGLIALSNPPLERLFDFSALALDADENCEKAIVRLLERDPDSLYDDFMIYRKRKFFGIGAFADLSRNISEIRGMDLDKAKRMQEFLMGRNAIGDPRIVVQKNVRMAHGIGGDYLHCMSVNDELSMLAAFDVCGKGTAAALLTSVLSSFFSTLKTCGTLADQTPRSILAALNRVVMDQTPEEIFIAAALVFIDEAKREISVFNCGYSPIFAFFTEEGGGKTKGLMVDSNLFPLGISEYGELRASAFPIFKHLRIFMYSDGLTDARNERGEQFGMDNLKRLLFPMCGKKASVIMDELDAEISRFIGSAPQADDIAVLIAEIL